MVTHDLLKGTTDLSVFVDTGIVEEAWSAAHPDGYHVPDSSAAAPSAGE
jgi:hypothetical protein